MIAAMRTPESGLFALGTSSHAYLELDAQGPDACEPLVSAVAALREPRTAMGGVNLVEGFRPERWRELAPEETPVGARGLQPRPRALDARPAALGRDLAESVPLRRGA